MSNSQLFSQAMWLRLVRKFAKEMYIPSPVVTFTLVDGSSFNVRNLRPMRGSVLVEAYDREGGITLKFIPWANIRDIEIKKEKPEIMEKMGYRL